MGNKKISPLMNVNWRKYFNLSNSVIVNYISNYGKRFIDQSFFKIKRAYTLKKPYIFLINFNASNDIVSVLYQNEYEESLNYLLKLCIHIEYYEMCAQIQKQLNSMDRRKRRKTNNPNVKVG
jgi:hypothetical protein